MSKFSLYPFQVTAVELLLKKKRQLLAYDMGLGKTVIALTAAEKLNLRTKIICPAFLKNTWKRAIMDFNIRDVRIDTWSNVKDDECPQVLIVDESHYGKNPESARTQAFLKVASNTRTTGGYVWLLSGTPAKNTAAELFTQFQAVGMTEFTDYEDFAETFADSYLAKYGAMSKPVKKYRGVRNVDVLRDLYRPFMHVLKARQVLDLPEQIKKEIMSDFSVFSLADISQFRPDALAIMRKHHSTKKMQQAKMNIPQTKSVIEDLKNTFDKIIVFSDHVDPAKELASHFSGSLITGETPIEQRDAVIDDFALRGNVLSCTIGAAGTGLNLQFANCMVFNDLPWVPGDLMQAEKRIHRIGQGERCHYFYVIDPGMGEIIYNTLQTKIAQLEGMK